MQNEVSVYDNTPGMEYKRFPYPFIVADDVSAMSPDELVPDYSYEGYFRVHDKCSGSWSPAMPFGTPLYYNGYVVEGAAATEKCPPHVTVCTAKAYLDKRNLKPFPQRSAEYTVLYKLVWEVCVRSCQPGVMMNTGHWLNLYVRDKALPYEHSAAFLAQLAVGRKTHE